MTRKEQVNLLREIFDKMVIPERALFFPETNQVHVQIFVSLERWSEFKEMIDSQFSETLIDIWKDPSCTTNPVLLGFKEELIKEILNDLERIISPFGVWHEDQLQMAKSTIEQSQKIAMGIKDKIGRRE